MERFDTRWIPQKFSCGQIQKISQQEDFISKRGILQKRMLSSKKEFSKKNSRKKIFLLGKKEYIYM